ncbi:bark leucoagglutinin-like [Cryptomeria japonica]|uniref:bark leucoagglutinin-like n=1 Tax=Cryptomeria japonica TaxID=3369 RepID=UPI0027DA1F16|nr:bark leucoagglutinin-like [Cryptomeria japonica]
MANYRAGFLLYLCITSSFWHFSNGRNVNFNFPPKTDIHLSGDASINMDVIQLTTCQFNNNSAGSIGWSISANIIPLWDDCSQVPASFSTHFQFRMPGCGVNHSGDGLAMFFAPPDFQSSDGDPGECLGLFKTETDGNSSNQIVAVEFDSF